MPQLSTEEKDELLNSVKEIRLHVDRIERGMYGDKENGVKGLIDRVHRIEVWITASKMKIAYVSGGIAAIVVSLKVIWDWVVEHFRTK